MYIIVKGKDSSRKLKGKSITEFSRNMESEGWPTEFVNAEERDRIKYAEKRCGRPAQREDFANVKRTMGTEIDKRRIEKLANKLKLTKFEHGFPQ